MPYQNETHRQNEFWSDVYYLMEATSCSKEKAIEEIEKQYATEFIMEDLIQFTRNGRVKKRKSPWNEFKESVRTIPTEAVLAVPAEDYNEDEDMDEDSYNEDDDEDDLDEYIENIDEEDMEDEDIAEYIEDDDDDFEL